MLRLLCVQQVGQGRLTGHWPTPDAPLTPIEEWYFFAIQGAYEADLESYRVGVAGLVDRRLSLTVDDLRDRFEPVEHVMTLACVGNPPGGRQMSAGRFRGARVADVLAAAGASPSAGFALVTGLDGYAGVLKVEELYAREAILAYDMGTTSEDLAPLPIDHGFPLRVLTPGLYGYPQPKWIDSISLVESDQYEVVHASLSYAHARMMLASGFSQPRDGWTIEAGSQEILGYAFGDGRPIARVELRFDDGDWQEAEIVYNDLEDELPAHLWALWRASWAAGPGHYQLECRATYADGETQIDGRAFPYSGGSITRIEVEVVA